MKSARATFTLCFFIVCNIALGQSFKIASVSSADHVSGKILEKQLAGKLLELTLSRDSATVTIPALQKSEKMRQTGPDQYTNIINASEERSTSLLTLIKEQGQLSSVKLKLTMVNDAGDKTEILIIAKL